MAGTLTRLPAFKAILLKHLVQFIKSTSFGLRAILAYSLLNLVNKTAACTYGIIYGTTDQETIVLGIFGIILSYTFIHDNIKAKNDYINELMRITSHINR